MPIGEYLKIAAAQLRRAANVSRDEAQELRRSLTIKEQETSRTVTSLQNQRSRLQSHISSEGDSNAALALGAQLVGYEKEIKEAQAELEKFRQSVNEEIRAKESQFGNLNQEATNFEQRASTSM